MGVVIDSFVNCNWGVCDGDRGVGNVVSVNWSNMMGENRSDVGNVTDDRGVCHGNWGVCIGIWGVCYRHRDGLGTSHSQESQENELQE